MPAGYSKTPLIKKLGIKPGFRVYFINEPPQYQELLGPLPEEVEILTEIPPLANFIHFFGENDQQFSKRLRDLSAQIEQNGMIWISWNKKKSRKEGHLNENRIREEALKIGLVDVKVCAVDETWSGLKLVIRKENRKK